MKTSKVLVIGAGLAGSEAALWLARNGIQVVLAECKSSSPTEAQKMNTAAELVCTNSLKSLKPDSGHGLLKYEMEGLSSVVLEVGKNHAVPAGDALAVDRKKFSLEIHQRLIEHPFITFIAEEVSDPIAAGKKHSCNYIIGEQF